MIDPAYQDLDKVQKAQRVVLLGASGTIGRATLNALLSAGHDVVCVLRRGSDDGDTRPNCRVVIGDLGDLGLLSEAFEGADCVMSCLASRSGAPDDAWAVDYSLNMVALAAARQAGVERFVLLSAICVQRPKLAFQHAKLAFEAELIGSGLTYSIIRPTAYFKSLSGQMDRMRSGKPYLAFGDGQLTACKPISDADLGRFMTQAISNPACENRVLPVGGPGPAVTPVEQGQTLAASLDVPFQMRRVPVALFDAIISVLRIAGWFSPRARAKAELARIGRYYATESMLVWDPVAKRYDAQATPEFGADRLEDFYDQLARGEVVLDRGAHAVF